jgi:competence protein ComGC
MTQEIPIEGYNYSSHEDDQIIPMLLVILTLEMLILIILPVVYQVKNYGKLKKVREEVLSLDSINILYR